PRVVAGDRTDAGEGPERSLVELELEGLEELRLQEIDAERREPLRLRRLEVALAALDGEVGVLHEPAAGEREPDGVVEGEEGEGRVLRRGAAGQVARRDQDERSGTDGSRGRHRRIVTSPHATRMEARRRGGGFRWIADRL